MYFTLNHLIIINLNYDLNIFSNLILFIHYLMIFIMMLNEILLIKVIFIKFNYNLMMMLNYIYQLFFR